MQKLVHGREREYNWRRNWRVKAMKTINPQDLGSFPKLSDGLPTTATAVSSSQNQVYQLWFEMDEQGRGIWQESVSESPGKWPWEVLFHLAAGNGILARRNLLLLPQFRISSPLPEHGFCTGNKERHPRLTQRVFQGKQSDAMIWNLSPVSHSGDTLSHSCLHIWEDQKNSTGN